MERIGSSLCALAVEAIKQGAVLASKTHIRVPAVSEEPQVKVYFNYLCCELTTLEHNDDPVDLSHRIYSLISLESQLPYKIVNLVFTIY